MRVYVQGVRRENGGRGEGKFAGWGPQVGPGAGEMRSGVHGGSALPPPPALGGSPSGRARGGFDGCGFFFTQTTCYLLLR